MGAYDSLLKTLAGDDNSPVSDEDVAMARARLRMKQNNERDTNIMAQQGALPTEIQRSVHPDDKPIEGTMSPIDVVQMAAPEVKLGQMAMKGGRALLGRAGNLASKTGKALRGELDALPMEAGMGRSAPGLDMGDAAVAAEKAAQADAYNARMIQEIKENAAKQVQEYPALLQKQVPPLEPVPPPRLSGTDPGFKRRRK